MEAERVLVLIVAMAAVTFASRLPLLAARRRLALPPLLRAVLDQIPVAGFAVIVVPTVLAPGGELDLAVGNLRVYAALAALAVAALTRSLFPTIVAGMGVLLVLRLAGAG